MSKFKKIIASAIVTATVMSQISYADEYSFRILREDGALGEIVQKILVEGKLADYEKNEQITLTIRPESPAASEIPADYLLFEQVFVKPDGTFVMQKELDATAQNIKISVNSLTKTLEGKTTEYFPSLQAIDNLKTALNNNTMTVEEIVNEISTDNVNLIFDTAVYNNLSFNAKKQVITDMKAASSSFTVGNIYSLFNEHTLYNALLEKENGNEAKVVLEHYENTLLNLENEKCYALFNNQTPDNQIAICGLIAGKPYDSITDVKNSFFDATIVGSSINVTSYEEIFKILDDYKTEMGIESIVNTLSGNDDIKDTALKYVVYEKNNIKTISDLTGKIQYAIDNTDAVKDIINGSFIQPPAPGGGGGGGGGGATIKVEEPLNSSNEVPKVTAKVYFSDIDSVPWAQEAILSLYDKGIIKGKTLGCFAPNDMVTRAEMVKMIVESVGDYDETATCSLEDLNSHWAKSYIASAYKKGYVSGISQSLFGPDNFITRQDASAVLYRVLSVKGKAVKIEDITSFADFVDKEKISEYAQAGVSMMSAYGIIKGYDDNTFRPLSNLTRAEAAVLIDRFLKQ